MHDISIQVNGEQKTIPAGLTVGEMLDHFQLKRAAMIVEHNRAILRKDALDTIEVREGDAFEIVRFVGGG